MPFQALPPKYAASLPIPPFAAVQSAIVTDVQNVLSAGATAVTTPSNANVTAFETAVRTFIDHWKLLQVIIAGVALNTTPTDQAAFENFLAACQSYTG